MEMDSRLKKFLDKMVDRGDSDLHIKAGYSPIYRTHGELRVGKEPVLSAEDTKQIAYSLMNDKQIEFFEQEREMDLGFEMEDIARFRTNIFWQRGKIGLAIRFLPMKIPTIEDCGLPADVIINKILSKRKGLILLTGATGSGKSTSIAAMLEWINNNRKEHIITVEDPIEYVYKSKNSVIDQREVGSDTLGFINALGKILREDPDVILIGEMRDLETVQAALNIAETGHLVFATLHTPEAIQTINRIIDIFPSHQQSQVRVQLSFVLLSVLTQNLIPRKDGKGRVLSYELMIVNHAIRSMIREQKAHQAYSTMQTGQEEGMSTMNLSLAKLYSEGKITLEDTYRYSTQLEDLKRILGSEAPDSISRESKEPDVQF